MTAFEAIARSISHNEIVHLDYNETTADHLRCACEDWVEASELEYWGTENGNEWRVHLRQQGRPDEQS